MNRLLKSPAGFWLADSGTWSNSEYIWIIWLRLTRAKTRFFSSVIPEMPSWVIPYLICLDTYAKFSFFGMFKKYSLSVFFDCWKRKINIGIESSVGTGKAKNVAGSKRFEAKSHFWHRTEDFSCNWNKSTISESLNFLWISRCSVDTSRSGRPFESGNSSYLCSRLGWRADSARLRSSCSPS